MRVKFITILCIINIAISSYIMNFVFSTEAIANIENIAQEEISHIGSTSYGSYLKSRHAENIGDFTSAASFTAQLLSTNPEIKGITRRGQILMISSGRIDEAAKFAEIIIRNNESDPLANITLAVVAFKNKNFNESISRLNKIPREGLQALIVPLLTGWALAGAGSRDKALDEIKKLRNIDGMGPIIGFHSGSISELYADYSSAENYYMKGIKESVGIPALKIIEAYVGYLLRSKQYDRASSLVKKFISENPKQLLIETTNLALEKRQAPEKLVKVYEHGAAEALSSVASMLKKEKLKQEALIMVQLAIYLRSDSPSILFLLGQILEENKQIESAIKAYTKIESLTPYGWYARLNLAESFWGLERAQKALNILRKMLRERPKRSDAARLMGDILRINERYRDSIIAYDKAIHRSNHKIDWRLYYSRGISLERSRKWARAETDFLKALELEPDQPYVLNYLGYSWIEQKKNLLRAKRMIEKAVRQRPEDGFIVDSLGWALYRLGDYAGAVIHLERAVLLEPGDPIINNHLGDAYWLANRRLEAVFQWRRSLSQQLSGNDKLITLDKLKGKKLPKPVPVS